ncbi:hypothetical protein Dimus_036954 [Dionaea muscipula]
MQVTTKQLANFHLTEQLHGTSSRARKPPASSDERPCAASTGNPSSASDGREFSPSNELAARSLLPPSAERLRMENRRASDVHGKVGERHVGGLRPPYTRADGIPSAWPSTGTGLLLRNYMGRAAEHASCWLPSSEQPCRRAAGESLLREQRVASSLLPMSWPRDLSSLRALSSSAWRTGGHWTCMEKLASVMWAGYGLRIREQRDSFRVAEHRARASFSGKYSSTSMMSTASIEHVGGQRASGSDEAASTEHVGGQRAPGNDGAASTWWGEAGEPRVLLPGHAGSSWMWRRVWAVAPCDEAGERWLSSLRRAARRVGTSSSGQRAQLTSVRPVVFRRVIELGRMSATILDFDDV